MVIVVNESHEGVVHARRTMSRAWRENPLRGLGLLADDERFPAAGFEPALQNIAPYRQQMLFTLELVC
jgi:hypothetical protein